MSKLEILKHPIFTLPRIRNVDYLPLFLEEIYKEYLEVIQGFDDVEGDLIRQNIDKIKGFCEQIIICV